MQTLPDRHARFVNFYLGECNGNATEAARRAGYKHPAAVGCRLLRKVNIRAEISRRTAAAAMSADEVLMRLGDMARGDVADFLRLDPPAPRPEDADPDDAWQNANVALDLKRARRLGKTHLIKSIKATKYGLSVELHDAQAALEKLGRYHGLFDRDLGGISNEQLTDALKEALGGGQAAGADQ